MNAYDSIAAATGVDRDTVKKVLLAANFDNTLPEQRLVRTMVEQVMRFQVDIINLPIPLVPTILEPKRASDGISHMNEEIAEIQESLDTGDLHGTVDGLFDLIYVALGRLIEMGVVPGAGFDEVHEANMRRVRGVKPNRPDYAKGFDAIKPPGWKEPDFDMLLSTSKEDLQIYWGMSYVLREVGRLRVMKGNDYNSGVALTDYFPFGHASYAHIVYQKALRGVSLVKLMLQGGKPNFEGIRDTMLDIINYASFYVEWMDAEKKAGR